MSSARASANSIGVVVLRAVHHIVKNQVMVVCASPGIIVACAVERPRVMRQRTVGSIGALISQARAFSRPGMTTTRSSAWAWSGHFRVARDDLSDNAAEEVAIGLDLTPSTTGALRIGHRLDSIEEKRRKRTDYTERRSIRRRRARPRMSLYGPARPTALFHVRTLAMPPTQPRAQYAADREQETVSLSNGRRARPATDRSRRPGRRAVKRSSKLADHEQTRAARQASHSATGTSRERPTHA